MRDARQPFGRSRWPEGAIAVPHGDRQTPEHDIASRNHESMKAEVRSAPHPMALPADGRWPSAIAAVVLIDARGCILDITLEAAAILGYEPEDLHGRSLTELAAPGWTTLTEGVLTRIRSGMNDDFALMLRGRSGRRTLLEMRARKVDGEGGAPGSHVLVWYQQETRPGGRTCRNDEPLRRLAYGLMTHQ